MPTVLAILPVFFLFCSLCLNLTRSSGVFEASLISFHNSAGHLFNGDCCDGPSNNNFSTACPGSCRTLSRICLGPSMTSIPSDFDNCAYGTTAMAEAIDTNSLSPTDANLGRFTLRIPFSWSWQERFTIVYEMLHEEKTTGELKLIMRKLAGLHLSPEEPQILRELSTTAANSSVSLSLRLKVTCDSNYYGPQCAKHCKPKDDGHGHTNCSTTGDLKCADGWTGLPLCDTPICKRGCKHGNCTEPGQCRCNNGWEGALCDKCVTYPGCKHGYCDLPFQCNCFERWGGLVCDQDDDYCFHKEPCRNGAECHPNGSNNFTCVCKEGFTGRNCEIMLSSCAHNPCQNFGTCVEDVNSHRHCECPPMYTGPLCENLLSSEKWYPCYDAESDTHYPHGAHWDTLTCKHCTCVDGYSRCSTARCSTDNCLSSTSFRRSICPQDQACHSVPKITCLKGVCPTAVGQCRWLSSLDNHSSYLQSCHGQPESDRCATFFAALETSKLPNASFIEEICFHMELFLWSRNISHVAINCSLAEGSSRAKDPLIRVQMASKQTGWKVADILDILVVSLLHNITSSPFLRAVVGASHNRSSVAGSHSTVNVQHYYDDLSDDRSKRFPWESAVLIAGSTAFCLSLVFVAGYFGVLRSRLFRAKCAGGAASDRIPAAIRLRIDKLVGADDSENGSVRVAQAVLQNNLWTAESTVKPAWSQGEKLCNLWRSSANGNTAEFTNELRDWGSREKVPTKTNWSSQPTRDETKSPVGPEDNREEEIVVDHVVTV